jgi:Mg2+-importing ATPase
MRESPREAEPRHRNAAQRASWLLGAAVLAAVIVVALRFSQGREFARLAERANPWWLLLALGLQAATYLAQAEVFRGAPQAAGSPLPRRWLYQLSVTKLFLDQALPSAGLSSTVVVTKALQQRGVPRDVAAAGAMISIASYHAAYVVTLLVALAISAILGQTNVFILLVSVLCLAFAIALTAALLALAGRRTRAETRLTRLPLVKGVVGFLEDANPALTRSPRLLTEATLWQMAIFLLDAATIWVLIRAVGVTAPGAAVFASFMISSVFRTVGVVPGGLGTYEAMSVLTLRMVGVSIPVALSATLIFRGLSFWLPMLPGLWFSRRVMTGTRDLPVFRDLGTYWALDADALAARLDSGRNGLSQVEAAARLRTIGPNQLRAHRPRSRVRVISTQLRNPLLLLLVFAAAASGWSGEWIDATIVLAIVVASVGISYSREYGAQAAVAALQAQVRRRTNVVRDGRTTIVPVEEVVPGDVVVLAAGSLVPADAVVLDATDFFVSEAVLTGESFPVEKRPGVAPASAPVRRRANCVFLGTNVRSGAAPG